MMNDEVCRLGARLRGYRQEAFAARNMSEMEMQGTRGSAMALVQYQQITGDGLGNAPRPPLRLGAFGRTIKHGLDREER
jgi:hypothetical protein